MRRIPTEPARAAMPTRGQWRATTLDVQALQQNVTKGDGKKSDEKSSRST